MKTDVCLYVMFGRLDLTNGQAVKAKQAFYGQEYIYFMIISTA